MIFQTINTVHLLHRKHGCSYPHRLRTVNRVLILILYLVHVNIMNDLHVHDSNVKYILKLSFIGFFGASFELICQFLMDFSVTLECLKYPNTAF